MQSDATLFHAARKRLIELGFYQEPNVEQREKEVYAVINKLFPMYGKYLIQVLNHVVARGHLGEDREYVDYHDRHHVFGLIWLLDKYMLQPNYRLLSDRLDGARILVMAAAFHDYGHSKGKRSDDYNIAQALSLFECVGVMDDGQDKPRFIELSSPNVKQAYEALADDVWFHNHGKDSVTVFIDTVVELISDTRYPYKYEVSNISLSGTLRHYDCRSMLLDDWFDLIYQGLFNELRANSKFAGMNLKDFALGQLKFLANLKPLNASDAYEADRENLMMFRAHMANQVIREIYNQNMDLY